MTSVHDWSHDVKKYISAANESAINGIVKYLGAALHSRDSSFVACEDSPNAIAFAKASSKGNLD